MPVAAVVVLGALAAVVYANALATPFVFDDRPAILANPHVRSLWPLTGAAGAPPRSVLTGRFVPSLSLAANYALGGLDPWGYHVGNVALHVGVALALFALVRRTLATPALAPAFGAARDAVALAIAAVWLVHPLQTEAVTYVTQRTELWAALFIVLTVYFATADRPVASVASAVLAVASKETAVAAPLLVVVHDRLFRFASFRDAWRARRGLYVGLAATWVLLGASLVAFPRHESIGPGGSIGMLAYARTQLEVVARYLGLALWPASLCVDYGVWTATVADALPGAIVVGALVALTGLALRRGRPAAYAGAWFLLLLAPTSSVVPIVTEVMAERRMYLPLAAVVGVFVCAGFRVVTRPRLRVGLVVVLIAVLGVLTIRRNRDYASEVGLWRDVIAKRPSNARAHNDLGSLLLATGDLDGATTELTAAVALRPDYAEAHYNLAVADLARNNLPAAAVHLHDALAHDPNLVEAHYNLATIYLHESRYPEAIAEYETTLRLDPTHQNARTNLEVARTAATARGTN